MAVLWPPLGLNPVDRQASRWRATAPMPGTPPSDRHARVDEAVKRLAATGATFVTASTNEYGEYCAAMLDPEGNEFDVQ